MTHRARIQHRIRRALRELRALPTELRNVPPLPKDTGAGHTLQYERNAWTIRPATGWRAHLGPPLHINHHLGPNQDDAASDWAVTIIGQH
jgi:hypothetical protein